MTVDTEPRAKTKDQPNDVQPWWQRPMNIIALVVTAALCFGMIGWAVGNSRQDAHNEVDVGFLQDMRVHHEQATYMALLYLNDPDTDPGLNTVAVSIMQGQNIEIGRMVQQLRVMGQAEARDSEVAPMLWMGMTSAETDMPGMASEADLERLGTLQGREADEFFVQLMNAHHEGGIEMADYAAEHAKNPEVIKMAEGMAKGQRGEIMEMTSVLESAHS